MPINAFRSKLKEKYNKSLHLLIKNYQTNDMAANRYKIPLMQTDKYNNENERKKDTQSVRDKNWYNIHNSATLRAINLCVDNSNDSWYILHISVAVVIAVPIGINIHICVYT